MTSGSNSFSHFPANLHIIFQGIGVTSLRLHFWPHATFFAVQRGRHGPNGPMVNTPLVVTNIQTHRPCYVKTCRNSPHLALLSVFAMWGLWAKNYYTSIPSEVECLHCNNMLHFSGFIQPISTDTCCCTGTIILIKHSSCCNICIHNTL